MFHIDWTTLATYVAIAFSIFMMGRLSKPRRVKLTPARIKLETTTPLDDMTDEQRALFASYCTVQRLKHCADPTWEAFMLAARGELHLPNTVTVDHLRGGEDIEVVLELIARAFSANTPAVATV